MYVNVLFGIQFVFYIRNEGRIPGILFEYHVSQSTYLLYIYVHYACVFGFKANNSYSAQRSIASNTTQIKENTYYAIIIILERIIY